MMRENDSSLIAMLLLISFIFFTENASFIQLSKDKCQ